MFGGLSCFLSRLKVDVEFVISRYSHLMIVSIILPILGMWRGGREDAFFSLLKVDAEVIAHKSREVSMFALENLVWHLGEGQNAILLF